MTESLSLIRYEAARAALAEAVSVDEVQEVRGAARQIKAYARIAKDKRLMADAASLQMRAERKLGVLIRSAMETGQLGIGRPAKSNVIGTPDPDQENGSSEEPFTRTTLSEAGIDKKLSMKAQTWARMGDDEFDAKLAEVRDKIESSGAAVINPQKDFSTADKKQRRETRERELGARQQALPDRRYGVIMADPEWPDDTWSEAGKDRSPENHYPTSTIAVIAARPVETIAADDTVMGLWIPMRHLAVGNHVTVMHGWGFEPKAILIWDKVVTGTGFWVRNRVEALVIGVRGKVPAPAPGTQWEDLVVSPKGAHSEKPDWAYEWFETYFPNLPKIELNARRRRDGWDAWGFEAPDSSAGQPPPLTPPRKGEGDTLSGDGQPSLLADAMSALQDSIRRDDLVDAAGGDPNTPPADPIATVEAAASSPAPGTRSVDGESPSAHEGEANSAHGQKDAATRTVAADPQGTPGSSPGAEGGGEGGPVGAGGALPHSDVSVEQLTSEQQNEIITAGYAARPRLSIIELMLATGLKRSTVKMRAIRLGLADPENQRAAARAVMGRINERRAGEAAE